MNTIKIDKKSTQMVAHRGLSGIEVENTNAAFVAAGNRSYYGVETDIHRTADGKFVLCHDRDLSRIGGVDIDVEAVSLEESLSVALFDKDGTKSRNDLRVSLLENYISICKKYEKQCVLELKSDFNGDEIAKIVDIIKGLEYLDNVTFISFGYDNLVKVRKLCPQVSAQFLFMQFTDEIIERLVADKFDVDVHYKALSKEMIDKLHSLGIKVNCWTVDNKETAEQLCEWGVDYITSNILE